MGLVPPLNIKGGIGTHPTFYNIYDEMVVDPQNSVALVGVPFTINDTPRFWRGVHEPVVEWLGTSFARDGMSVQIRSGSQHLSNTGGHLGRPFFL